MNQLSHKNHIEQGRSQAAYQFVEEAKRELGGGALDRSRSEYKSYVRKMPMLIKTNGIGAAVAFAFAKGSRNGLPERRSAWGLIYLQLGRWLQEDQKNLLQLERPELLSKALVETDSATYRAVTVELLGLLGWMRRFVDALIEGEG